MPFLPVGERALTQTLPKIYGQPRLSTRVVTMDVTPVKSSTSFLKTASENSTPKKEQLFIKKSTCNCGMTSHIRGSISVMPIMDLTSRYGDTITVLAAPIIMVQVSLPYLNQPGCSNFPLNSSTWA